MSMVDTSQPPLKKRRRFNPKKPKFTLKQRVEVRSFEDGFQGSWHSGVVIDCKSGKRVVRYDHLLADNEDDVLVETVEVSRAIDGETDVPEMKARGTIRPPPPRWSLAKVNIPYGTCVDWYYHDAWWEGVVFDCEDGAKHRKVFFPDLGDIQTANVKELRITQDWNENTGEWKPRGVWLFLEILEKYNVIPVSITQIWYDVRVREEFSHIGDWCSSSDPSRWEKLIMQVIDENLNLTIEELLSAHDFREEEMPECQAIVAVDSALSPKPSADIDLPDVGEWSVVAKWPLDSQDGIPCSASDVLSDDQVVPEQPKALSIICSGPDRRRHVVKRKLCKDSESGKRQWGKIADVCWEVGKLNLEPVSCPGAIDEYYCSTKPKFSVTTAVRQHLISEGWTIATYSDATRQRCRYTSPEGKKFFILRDIVKTMVEERKKSDKMEKDIQKSVVLSPNSLMSGRKRSSPTVDDIQEPVISSPTSLKSGRKRPVQTVDEVQESIVPDPDYTEVLDKSETKIVLSRQIREAEKGNYFDLTICSEYSPRSVFKYFKFCRNSRGVACRKLQDKVRKHLSAIGWSFWIKVKSGIEEWRYDSPTSNKTYYSLKRACRAIVDGQEINTRKSSGENDVTCSVEPMKLAAFRSPNVARQHRPLGTRRSKRKQSSFQLPLHSLILDEGWDQNVGDDLQGAKNVTKRCKKLVSSFISKKRKALGKVRNSSKGHSSGRVLRSSKRVRQTGPSTSSQVPRTVLSWLIDNNVIVPRSKVFYYRGDGQVVKEGRIASDGITCSCCQKVFTLSKFEVHASARSKYPAENIYLEDGSSIASCQLKMMGQKLKGFSKESVVRAMGKRHRNWNDIICSICHYGGVLIMCDRCPSSFHSTCLNLESIPDGDWFCPSCCCAICGESQCDLNAEHFSDRSILSCFQCERQYHACCIRDREMVKLDVRPQGKWFCCKTCERVQWSLESLLGKPILVGGHDNLTWTLVKPMHYQVKDFASKAAEMTENYCKLSVALDVMHECFEPVKDPLTKRDLVEDVLFCRGSNLNRLNFKGFFTVLLERNDELISVATLRVYGDTVAEIPLIGTRFQYRRLGMCRILMNEVEKNLIELGVKKLVLPAAPGVINTWTTSFEFSRVTESDRSAFLGFSFLEFQDTILCQKVLGEPLSIPPRLPQNKPGLLCQQHLRFEGSSPVLEQEGNSCTTEVHPEDKREGNDTVDQGAHLNDVDKKCKGASDSVEVAPVPMETCSSKTIPDPSSSLAPPDEKEPLRENCEGTLKLYTRKKEKELRPPVPQTSYSKVEVSCR